MRAWTDYPFTFLGDTPNQQAPVRNVNVLFWDQDKYATIIVDGKHLTDVKAGYLYRDKALKERINPDHLPRQSVRDLDYMRVIEEMQMNAPIPSVNIMCEGREGIVGFSTNLNVVRVVREDDGSLTAVTDYWPD
ncbi:MAG: hypothetical protein AB7U75_14980 [Hyphomicrobiaceae bacterium]